jgi:hypothetical protein
MVLALSGPGGFVPPTAALAAALALAAAASVLGLAQWRHMDELMRNLSTECGNVTFYLVLLFGGGWAMLAHLGFAPAAAPLDWLSMFFALLLVAAYVVTGRRGLLKPR